MHAIQVLVQGTLKPDGTLELNERPSLPPGEVEVLIRLQPQDKEDVDTWWDYLQRALAERLAQGQAPRSKEEIDIDRARQRGEDETRRQNVLRLQMTPE